MNDALNDMIAIMYDAGCGSDEITNAELLYQAATGNSVPNPTEGDITADNLLDMTIVFNVRSSVSGKHATVTVSWTFDDVETGVSVERDFFGAASGGGG